MFHGTFRHTQRQFRNYQLHFVKKHFGTSGGVGHLVGHTKLPFLLQELAPEFCHKERRTGVLSEENRIARTTANPRASARKKDEPLGADREASERVPELLAREGATKFREAVCQVSPDWGATGFDAVVGLPAFVSDEITVPTA
jgi:hypothetical protein